MLQRSNNHRQPLLYCWIIIILFFYQHYFCCYTNNHHYDYNFLVAASAASPSASTTVTSNWFQRVLPSQQLLVGGKLLYDVVVTASERKQGHEEGNFLYNNKTDKKNNDNRKLTTSIKQQQQQRRQKVAAPILAAKKKTTTATTTTTTTTTKSTLQSLWFYVRIGLAGGIGGAVGTIALYPVDCAKTLRQSNPNKYPSVQKALSGLLYSNNGGGWHIGTAYKGLVPAALGAIPSSALYFGAYESVKVTLKRYLENTTTTTTKTNNNNINDSTTPLHVRLAIHGISAACGNILSSAIFVPKELIKQQLQYQSSNNIGAIVYNIIQTNGIAGLYIGYQATLMRNIPTAMLRFIMYEEFKRLWYLRYPTSTNTNNNNMTKRKQRQPLGLVAAGGMAGSLASGIMTPIDVVKTRLATGTCPVGVGSCTAHIIKEVGWKGLYAGAGSRILFSGVFAAVGFTAFELAKVYLGVDEDDEKVHGDGNDVDVVVGDCRGNKK